LQYGEEAAVDFKFVRVGSVADIPDPSFALYNNGIFPADDLLPRGFRVRAGVTRRKQDTRARARSYRGFHRETAFCPDVTGLSPDFDGRVA
jgi:hypothetical protein